jgi:4-alpha-glucanotransferase
MNAAGAGSGPFSRLSRSAGILLHPTALPAEPGDGVLGAAAIEFMDHLAEAGVQVWQMLPIHPVHADRSPYLPLSLFAAGEHLLSPTGADPDESLRSQARELLDDGLESEPDYLDFCRRESDWLDTWADFAVLRRRNGSLPWPLWPEPWREARKARAALVDCAFRETAIERALQFLFDRRWQTLRRQARERGIALFGDLPMFPSQDSAEVWAEPELFRLDAAGWPTEAAGAPPDAFAPAGQRWGGAVYDWPAMAAQGHAWWIRRLQRQARLFDLLRLDHFRGFQAYWSIPASVASAGEGRYVPGPGIDFFRRLSALADLPPLVAEDLGMITPDVEALRRAAGLPGIRVFQFGFDGSPDNPHLPSQVEEDCVYYSATHDNDTTLGWWRGLDAHTQDLVLAAAGGQDDDLPWPALRAVLASRARLAVLPLQDALALGSAARFNTPGTMQGNWSWVMPREAFDPACRSRLRALLEAAGRA